MAKLVLIVYIFPTLNAVILNFAINLIIAKKEGAMCMAKNIIIITGASSGIGQEFAITLDKGFTNIDEFWLISRNREKLQVVSKQLKHKTRILNMDITTEAQIERLQDTLMEHDCIVRMLINCAGMGMIGDFKDMDIESQLEMIRLNCEALTNVTYCCLAFMKRNSRIIQMASSAAFMPQPGFSVYAATKSYVNSFSLALGAELADQEIYVTSVCSGPVDTPFFNLAEQTGEVMALKKWAMANATDVVEKALKDSFFKKPKSVYGCPIQGLEFICKLLPHSALIKIVAKLKKK